MENKGNPGYSHMNVSKVPMRFSAFKKYVVFHGCHEDIHLRGTNDFPCFPSMLGPFSQTWNHIILFLSASLILHLIKVLCTQGKITDHFPFIIW